MFNIRGKQTDYIRLINRNLSNLNNFYIVPISTFQMRDGPELNFTSIFLIISLTLKFFSFFTPLQIKYQENKGIDRVYLFELGPFAIVLIALVLIPQLILIFNLLSDIVEFNQFYYRSLQFSILFWILLASISSSSNSVIETPTTQIGFGHYVLWLSIWFEVIAMIFYRIEYHNRSIFPVHRFVAKEPLMSRAANTRK